MRFEVLGVCPYLGKMVLRDFVRAGLSLIGLLSLLACNGQMATTADAALVLSTPNLDTSADDGAFDFGSCTYGLSDGGTANLAMLNQHQLATASFQKRFNKAWLNAIEQSNITTSLQFVQSTGVHVYHEPAFATSICSQNLYASTTPVPADIDNAWTGGLPRSTTSTVLGLYLPVEEPGETDLPSNQTQAAITVLENTGRWTLVHEFMHHLFMLQARSEGFSKLAVIKNMQQAIAAAGGVDTSSAAPLMETQVLTLVQYVRAYDAYMLHFALEEVTIEKYLKDEFANGNLQYVVDDQNWYLVSNVQKFLAYSQPAMAALKKAATTPGLTSGTQTAVQGALSEVTSLMNEANQAANQYSEDESKSESELVVRKSMAMGLVTSGAKASVLAKKEPPCAHDLDSDRIYKQSAKFFAKFQ